MKFPVRALHSARASEDRAAAAPEGDLVPLGPVAELARRRRCVVPAPDVEFLVLYGRRRFTVLENRCPHRGSPLDTARIGRRSLVCSTHSYKYSLADGAHLPTAGCRLGRGGHLTLFPSRIVDEWLFAVVGQKHPG